MAIDIPVKSRSDQARGEIKRLNDELRRLRREAGKLDGANKKARKSAVSLSGSLRGVSTSASGVTGVALGTAGAVAAMAYELGSTAVKASAEFEQSITRTAAVTDGSTANLERFRKAAVSASLESAYSAQQAGDALAYMGMAGFSAVESTSALPSVMQLAAASGAELGRSADILTNVLTGYGQTTNDLVHVNDVLVATFTSTNTTIQSLGSSLKYIGPVASGSGLELEEMAAAVGLLGNAGIQGTMAGTTLRSSIIRLQAPTKSAAAVLKRLGVDALDANGELRDLSDVLADLRDAGASTGDLSAIFGKRAVAGIQALISQGPERLALMAERFKEIEGIAVRIERLQLDTVSGQFQILEGSAQTFLIRLGDVSSAVTKDYLTSMNAALVSSTALDTSLTQLDHTMQGGHETLSEFGVVASAVAVDQVAQLVSALDSAAHMVVAVSEGYDRMIDLLPGVESAEDRVAAKALLMTSALDGIHQALNPITFAMLKSGEAMSAFRGEAELGMQTAGELAREIENTLEQRGIERLGDSFVVLGDKMRGFRLEARLAIGEMERIGSAIVQQAGVSLFGADAVGESASAEQRANAVRLRALRAENEATRIRLDAKAKLIELEDKELDTLARKVRRTEIIVARDEKLAQLAEQRARAAEQREQERQRALEKQVGVRARMIELAAGESAVDQALARLAAEQLRLSAARVTPEEQRLRLLEHQLDVQKALTDEQIERNNAEIDAIQRANDARIKALQQEREEVEKWQTRMESVNRANGSDLDYLLERNGQDLSWEAHKGKKTDARAAARQSIFENVGRVSSRSAQYADDIATERAEPIEQRLEELESVDTSKFSEERKRALDKEIEAQRAKLEAIEEQNDALQRQYELYGQIGAQSGVLAESLADLASSQWEFKNAQDATVAAGEAVIAMASLGLEAAGLGVRERAKWMAAFEAAAAIAATAAAITWKSPTLAAAAVQHGLAAAQFGAIAAGAIGGGGGAAASAGGGAASAYGGVPTVDVDAEREKSIRAFAEAIREEQAQRPTVIHVDFGSSVHANGRDEAARMIRDVVMQDEPNTFTLRR